ncbi:MAG: hypothetical protein M3P30_13840 [Chloroflexota bacterium]|nr:hypothetical protein [Chloroflexota bacterium]
MKLRKNLPAKLLLLVASLAAVAGGVAVARQHPPPATALSANNDSLRDAKDRLPVRSKNYTRTHAS